MYAYFLYSQQQVDDKNELLDKMNRKFQLGTVIYNGKKREYSSMSDKPELPRYADVRIVAEGDTDKLVYTSPRSVQKRNEV